jgi:hypothetical protein
MGNRITKITKMVIVIEEKIKQTKQYTLHKVTFNCNDDGMSCYRVRLAGV